MNNIPEEITKEAVEGFESIRVLGPVNMFNRTGVQHEAQQRGYEDLAFLSKPEYIFILKNYEALIKHYQIERGIVCQPTYYKDGGPPPTPKRPPVTWDDCGYPTCPDECMVQ